MFAGGGGRPGIGGAGLRQGARRHRFRLRRRATGPTAGGQSDEAAQHRDRHNGSDHPASAVVADEFAQAQVLLRAGRAAVEVAFIPGTCRSGSAPASESSTYRSSSAKHSSQLSSGSPGPEHARPNSRSRRARCSVAHGSSSRGLRAPVRERRARARSLRRRRAGSCRGRRGWCPAARRGRRSAPR